MDRDEHLKQVIRNLFTDLSNTEIRGVMAFWEKDTANIIVYLPKQLSESDMEDIECVLTEVIAQFSEGMFQESYVFLTESQPLPVSENWAYLKLDPEEFKYAKLFSKLNFALNGRYDSLCLKGIAVEWENNVISLYFYTYAFLQNWLEAAFVGICAEIAYQYTTETVMKHIIQLKIDDCLPNHKYWAYKKVS